MSGTVCNGIKFTEYIDRSLKRKKIDVLMSKMRMKNDRLGYNSYYKEQRNKLRREFYNKKYYDIVIHINKMWCNLPYHDRLDYCNLKEVYRKIAIECASKNN